jgi:hypothetical protein
MRKALTLFSTLIAGIVTLVWTGAGETSDPTLTARELPAGIVNPCTATAPLEACQAQEFNRRWVGRSSRGDLFVVTDDRCSGNGCRAWLVEKSDGFATTLLTFDRNFRLRQAPGAYPVIETYTELSSTQAAYGRFEWNGRGYTRTAERLIYRVDGTECGTSDECRAAAAAALKQQQVDRAVKIWENVHGVSWI